MRLAFEYMDLIGDFLQNMWASSSALIAQTEQETEEEYASLFLLHCQAGTSYLI